MSISASDFQAIAQALHRAMPPTFTEQDNDLLLGKTIAWEQCCIALADCFDDLNPRFNRGKFFTACQNLPPNP